MIKYYFYRKFIAAMKKLLTTLFLLSLTLTQANAQDNSLKVFDLSAMDTVWQAQNNKVCKKDTATYYKLYSISSEPDRFLVNQYYITGELYMTGRLTSLKPEHRDGDFYWFYKNSRKQRKVTYKNDRVNSTKWWDINGVEKFQWIRPVWSESGKLNVEEILLDKIPEFPGGLVALQNYISKNLRYPSMAKFDRVEGRVVVRFVIDETGKVTYTEVLKKINPDLEAEAIRVIRDMPAWSPAIYEGHPESVVFSMPIVFRLLR